MVTLGDFPSLVVAVNSAHVSSNKAFNFFKVVLTICFVSLTQTELETLCRIYGRAEGKEKEILFRIIHKYGADKLQNGCPVLCRTGNGEFFQTFQLLLRE